MSQEYVADQLGISRQAVAKWESGKSEPTVANLAELASLFEMSISELIDTKKYAEERDVQTQKCDDKQRNSKMLFGRWGAVALINAGWNGYSSGLYYWLAILVIGLVMIFSIFFLPHIISLEQIGVNYFLADIVTAICAIILSLKYWRYIWKVK